MSITQQIVRGSLRHHLDPSVNDVRDRKEGNICEATRYVVSRNSTQMEGRIEDFDLVSPLGSEFVPALVSAQIESYFTAHGFQMKRDRWFGIDKNSSRAPRGALFENPDTNENLWVDATIGADRALIIVKDRSGRG